MESDVLLLSLAASHFDREGDKNEFNSQMDPRLFTHFLSPLSLSLWL